MAPQCRYPAYVYVRSSSRYLLATVWTQLWNTGDASSSGLEILFWYSSRSQYTQGGHNIVFSIALVDTLLVRLLLLVRGLDGPTEVMMWFTVLRIGRGSPSRRTRTI